MTSRCAIPQLHAVMAVLCLFFSCTLYAEAQYQVDETMVANLISPLTDVVKPVGRNPFASVNPHASDETLGDVSLEEAVLGSSYIEPVKILPKITMLDNKITLALEDVSVRDLLQQLAVADGRNLVLGEAVTGYISLNVQLMPWEQVIALIMNMHGLDKRYVGGTLMIDKASAFLTREEVAIEEKRFKESIEPLAAELFKIQYAKASDIANILNEKTNTLLSKRGIVSVDKRTNIIWVHDTPERLHSIRTLISHIDIPIQQVMIEARIVNLAKDSAQDLGARFGITGSIFGAGSLEGGTRYANGVTPVNIPLDERLNHHFKATPLEGAPATIGVALAKLGNHHLLDLELSALESEGRAEIIASPRLMTTNQQVAIIESGEDIPYQETTRSGATSISFRKAALRLKVTPQIISHGRLLMDLVINQDADSGRRVQGVPIVATKAVEASVVVSHGQTIVLGGIYKRDKSNNVVRVPLLGTLPVIKYLFSRKQLRMKKEELLIFITPRIIGLPTGKNA